MNDLDGFDNIYDWVKFGLDKGWISDPSCYHHDALDITEEEEAEMDEGGDPCISIVRIWNL